MRFKTPARLFFSSLRSNFIGAIPVSLILLLSAYSLAACGGVMHDTPSSQNNVEAQSDATATAQPSPTAPSSQSVPVYTYEVVNSWPHDTQAFTQGLVFYRDALYESTGHYGASTLRKVELRTGKVAQKAGVDARYFAEGMTIFREKIYQLTWMGHKGFIYDLKSFHTEGEFAYEGEGWGLTHDGQSLIMSDGTNRIRFLDPQTFKVIRTISVDDHGQPLMELNELEYIKGEIYANVWKTDRIVRLDPQSGRILGWIDLTGLLAPEERHDEEDVLNGIAYDEQDDRLFVTGKRWPKLFEIRLKKK